MDVGTRMEYLRKEHQDFLGFLENWDCAIEMAASKEPEECVRGLNLLRDMKPGMKAIKAHCTSEENNVESPYHQYLEKGQFELLQKEHRDLWRLLENLFVELRFATLFQTERAVNAGREAASLARKHIKFEEELLAEIEQKLAEEAEQKLLLRYTQSPE